MTHDVFFDNAATKLCQADLKLLTECNEKTLERGHGRLVSCLYDNLKKITESACRGFINQIQVVVLTDWRLSEFFSEECQKDIVDLKCGRLDADNDTVRRKRTRCMTEEKHGRMLRAILVAPWSRRSDCLFIEDFR